MYRLVEKRSEKVGKAHTSWKNMNRNLGRVTKFSIEFVKLFMIVVFVAQSMHPSTTCV